MKDKSETTRQVSLAEAQQFARELGHKEIKVRFLAQARKVGTGVDELILNDGSRRVVIKPDRTTKDKFLIIETSVR